MTEQNAFAILESLSIAVLTFDRQYRYVYVNSEAERLLGYHREQMLGRTRMELFPFSRRQAVRD